MIEGFELRANPPEFVSFEQELENDAKFRETLRLFQQYLPALWW